jgi:hypothetical protein
MGLDRAAAAADWYPPDQVQQMSGNLQRLVNVFTPKFASHRISNLGESYQKRKITVK